MFQKALRVQGFMNGFTTRDGEHVYFLLLSRSLTCNERTELATEMLPSILSALVVHLA